MTATRDRDSSTPGRILYLALELGWNDWKLGFSTSPAEPVRQRTLRAAAPPPSAGRGRKALEVIFFHQLNSLATNQLRSVFNRSVRD